MPHREFSVPSKLCRNYESLMLKASDPNTVLYSHSLYQIMGRYIDITSVSKINFRVCLFLNIFIFILQFLGTYLYACSQSCNENSKSSDQQ